MENKKELYCYIIDSAMNTYKIKQRKMQKLFSDGVIAPLDINEQTGNDDITELLETIVFYFNKNNKYDLQYIADYFNDLVCEMGEE